jgi:hypothetical protein
MTTTLKDLLHAINILGDDRDVLVDGIDEIAVCPPVMITPEGLNHFATALGAKVKVAYCLGCHDGTYVDEDDETAQRAKSYRQHLRAKRQAEDAQQLTDSFQVKEYNGKLWITCRGVAINEITPGTNADTVVALIAEARRSALAFNS